jgi:carbon-monoxide dehydrogenase medium subunit
MKAAAFAYLAAQSVPDALRALADGGDDARVIAGGQSLGPMLNLRLAMPSLLIDISRIAALRRVEDRGDAVFIGAAVTHAEIEDRRHALGDGGILARVARGIAYRSVRNRGTIGGSIAHADPAADWPTALTALGARVVLLGEARRREVALNRFITGAFATALEPGEIVEGVLLPKIGAHARWGYYKICRKPGEYADAMAAVLADPDRRVCRIVVGATSGRPVLLDGLAARLAAEGAQSIDRPAIASAVAGALPGADAVDAHLKAVAVARAIGEAAAA